MHTHIYTYKTSDGQMRPKMANIYIYRMKGCR